MSKKTRNGPITVHVTSLDGVPEDISMERDSLITCLIDEGYDELADPDVYLYLAQEGKEASLILRGDYDTVQLRDGDTVHFQAKTGKNG
jgi:hypothetical protein